MPNSREALARHGVDIGERGQPSYPARRQLEQLGFSPNTALIAKWRAGVEPAGTVERLESGRLLERGNSKEKYEFLASVAGVGTRVREASGKNPHRFGSGYLLSGIAKELGWEPRQSQYLRRSLRAFRADLAYGVLPTVHRESFWQTVGDYFAAYLSRPENSPDRIIPQIAQLRDQWDGSVRDFYRRFYSIGQRRILSGFFPYELDFWKTYALFQSQMGNPLTELDFLLLRAAKENNWGPWILCDFVRESSGVPVDPVCLAEYRHVLMWGDPRQSFRQVRRKFKQPV